MHIEKKRVATLWLPIIAFLVSCSFPKNTVRESIPKKSSTGVLQVDDFSLKYIRRGAGDPIFIIGSADYYSKAFSAALERHFDMIFIDSRHFVPGCQPSDKNPEEDGLHTFSRDVDTIRKHLNLNKVSVIGHSVHAQIALDYASRYPQQVDKLILICGVPYTSSQYSAYSESLWNTEASEDRKSRMNANNQISKQVLDTTSDDRRFAVSYYYNAPRYWADPAYDARPLLKDIRTCPRLMTKLFTSVPNKETVIEKLKALNIPTLVIQGRLDFAVPYTAWQELIKVNPRIQFVLMNEASHNPQTEGSTVEAFNRNLLKWVKSIK